MKAERSGWRDLGDSDPDPRGPLEPMTVRMPHGAVRALEIISREQTRTRSLQILHYVREGLIADGCLNEVIHGR